MQKQRIGRPGAATPPDPARPRSPGPTASQRLRVWICPSRSSPPSPTGSVVVPGPGAPMPHLETREETSVSGSGCDPCPAIRRSPLGKVGRTNGARTRISRLRVTRAVPVTVQRTAIVPGNEIHCCNRERLPGRSEYGGYLANISNLHSDPISGFRQAWPIANVGLQKCVLTRVTGQVTLRSYDKGI